MSWLALDIGGANLKIANGEGFAASRFFPLWQQPDELASALGELLVDAPAADRLAVTMTGELADCFSTKAEGVAAILDAVEGVASGREILIYLCNGTLVAPETALAEAILAAASNWCVLGDFARRFCPNGMGLLIDIGSTTTDFIPLEKEGPEAIGSTDPERLASGELVYTGVERSPVCALVQQLSWRGQSCGVAQELFATSADAHLVLGDLPEDSSDRQTADGRPRTKEFAHARLARMLCADTSMLTLADAHCVALEIKEAQLTLLEGAIRRVLARRQSLSDTVVLSGHGEFLARQLLKRVGLSAQVVSLTEELGPAVNRCAPAHALAVLCHERRG